MPSGSASIEAWTRSPSIVPARGLTRWSAPGNPLARRFLITTLPGLPGDAEAPMTATLRGAKNRLIVSASAAGFTSGRRARQHDERVDGDRRAAPDDERIDIDRGDLGVVEPDPPHRHQAQIGRVVIHARHA